MSFFQIIFVNKKLLCGYQEVTIWIYYLFCSHHNLDINFCRDTFNFKLKLLVNYKSRKKLNKSCQFVVDFLSDNFKLKENFCVKIVEKWRKKAKNLQNILKMDI